MSSSNDAPPITTLEATSQTQLLNIHFKWINDLFRAESSGVISSPISLTSMLLEGAHALITNIQKATGVDVAGGGGSDPH